MGLLIFSPYQAFSAEALTDVNPAPLNLKGIYEFRLGAIQIGKMGFESAQTPSQYAMTADIMTTGLVKTFVKHSSHTTVDASGGKDFVYPSREYESSYQTRKKKKYVKMLYKDGKLTEEKLVPPDNRATRPAVKNALKEKAVDPLTFLLAMRQSLFRARQQKQDSFTLDVYDGRRLTEAHFTIGGTTTLKYNKRKVPVVIVDISRKLIAGFTASEIEDHDPGEPTLHVYFTNDEKLIPIHMEFDFWMGNVSATLAKECRTGESCLLGIKE